MGKADTAPPPYRDDPSLDDALSLHTTADDADLPSLGSEPNSLAVPPPYRDVDGNLDAFEEPLNIRDNRYVSGVMNLDEEQRRKDGTYWLVGGFDNDPDDLQQSIKNWAMVPPAKLVQIVGQHKVSKSKDGKTEQQTVTDFDVKLRLTEYLFSHREGRSMFAELDTVEPFEKTYRGTILKKRDLKTVRDVESPKAGLQEWCHRFTAKHAQLKSFTFQRKVTGLDEAGLKEMIVSLVRSTNYRGHLTVSFPIENPAIEVYNDHWINRWRNNGWIKFLFYLTFFWIFSWPYLFFITKKYTVVVSKWPFSFHDESGDLQYVTMSEKQWFNRWSRTIEQAVVGRRQTILTEEDLTRGNETSTPQSTGNSTVDAAVGYFSAGLQAYGQVNRQLGWGYDT